MVYLIWREWNQKSLTEDDLSFLSYLFRKEVKGYNDKVEKFINDLLDRVIHDRYLSSDDKRTKKRLIQNLEEIFWISLPNLIIATDQPDGKEQDVVQ